MAENVEPSAGDSGASQDLGGQPSTREQQFLSKRRARKAAQESATTGTSALVATQHDQRTVASEIRFNVRELDFGATVLRTSSLHRVALLNHSDHELKILLELDEKTGFHVKRKPEEKSFLLQAKSKLIIPLRYKPLKLGVARTSLVARAVAVNGGRSVYRAVCSLHGHGK